jgi:Zn-dependent protease/predicted transcriptional regulator
MDTTFRLGRIAGIPIGLSWTWIPIFGLFVWSLGANVFPSTNPGLAGGTYLAMAAAAALMFFVSLLLHELGHALRARRDGVEIDGITLWLLGGVARFRGGFPTAGAEFRIAVAGPLVTAGLAAGFIGLAALTHFGAAIDGVFAWLGYINVFLLVFNLIPALPLDGGRIFRSALWRLKSDHAWATRIAAVVGIAIGASMIAAGTVSVFVMSGFTGVWLALIGWFILSAARSELQLVTLQGALEGFVVSDLMTHHPIVSQADQTVRDFMAQIPADDQSAAYPVLDGLRPIGILPSPRRQTKSGIGDVAASRVRDRMVRLDQLPLLTSDEPAPEAMLAMVDAKADNALVMDDGQLAGIVSARDIDEALKLGESRLRSRTPARYDPARRN